MCRVTWVTVLVTIALAMSHVSQARADDKQEQARHEFSLGEDDDRAGKFEAAIGHYMRANDVLPHPFNLYNIAVDYERLGNLRQAGEWYERYLAAAPTSPDHDRVARTVADLKSHDSPLSVRTIPDGATVTIDGNAAGTTPLATKLPGGTHHVAVDLDGQHAEKAVELAYGEPGDVAFTLSGTPGQLYVFGTPAGAYVAVDNITVGALPATVPLPAGPHTVRVTASGYSPFETGTVVEPNATASVEVRLQRDLGAVDAQTTPKLPVGYSLGAVGGADVKKGDPLVLGIAGFRVAQYEGELRLGHDGGGTELGLLFHWYVLPTVITPYLSFGYSWGGIGFGYILNGGLRWDVGRGEHTGFAVLADIGLHTFSDTDSSGSTVTGITYPLELAAEVTFR